MVQALGLQWRYGVGGEVSDGTKSLASEKRGVERVDIPNDKPVLGPGP